MAATVPSTALVTGLPRSGTTLTCELLNRVPDVVALDEPMDRATLCPPVGRRRWARRRAPGVDAGAVAGHVARFLATQRASLLAGGPAISKQVGGRVVGAKVADDGADGGGVRTKLARRGEILAGKPLTEDFLLVAKHNAAFVAVLPALAVRFPVTAVVRNPLPTLASWQTVPFPVRDGHATLAELLDPSLAEGLARIPDRVDRQLHLADWYFERIRRTVPAERVVRYEDLVASGGAALAAVTPPAGSLAVPLASRNRAPVYGPEVTELAARILDADGAWWRFYSPDEVRGVLDRAS